MQILLTGWIPEEKIIQYINPWWLGDDHPSTWDHELWPRFVGDCIFSAGDIPSPHVQHRVSCAFLVNLPNKSWNERSAAVLLKFEQIWPKISHRMMDTWPYKPSCQMRTPAANPWFVFFKLRIGVRYASTRQLAKGIWRGPEIDKRSSAGLGI